MKTQIILFSLFSLLISSCDSQAQLIEDLTHLQQSYPEQIQAVSENKITWKDGTTMPASDGTLNKSTQEKLENPSLLDQVEQPSYLAGKPDDIEHYHPLGDPGRIRYQPFFQKMYGETQAAVEKNLTTIYWMPGKFGTQYPLKVTTVNHVDQQFKKVSDELEKLPFSKEEFEKYLSHPAGTYVWRVIAGTHRLSPHSFGMTFDLFADKETGYSNYWRWDLEKSGVPETEITETTPLHYQNRIPWVIVLIFEKYGFIWGGKWEHYDTMHFEYRPEMFVSHL